MFWVAAKKILATKLKLKTSRAHLNQTPHTHQTHVVGSLLFAEFEKAFTAQLIKIVAIRSPLGASGRFCSSLSDNLKR